MEAGEKGEYALINFDKRVFNDKHTNMTSEPIKIVRIGGTRSQHQPMRYKREKRVSDLGYLDQSDMTYSRQTEAQT